MSFGMFGPIFLLAQFFQTVQGYSPLGSGLRILPWTAMPMAVAPIAGALSDRISASRIIGTGLALQAIGLGWIAAVGSPTAAYSEFVVPFVLSGVGMGMFFAPIANVVLSAVRGEEEGQASGANNAVRELGGVLGVAVLASVFSRYGGDTPGAARLDGVKPPLSPGGAGRALRARAAVAPLRPALGADRAAPPAGAPRVPPAAEARPALPHMDGGVRAGEAAAVARGGGADRAIRGRPPARRPGDVEGAAGVRADPRAAAARRYELDPPI